MKLAVFDMDGTLIENGKFPESAKTALHQMKKNGVKLAIASGRGMNALDADVVDQVIFDYFICNNGMHILDHKYQDIYLAQISQETVDRLTEDFKEKRDALLLVYTERAFCVCGKDQLRPYREKQRGKKMLVGTEEKEAVPVCDALPVSGLAYIQKGHLPFYKNKYPELSFVYSGTKEYYDLIRKHECKAKAVALLCEQTNILPEETIAFGDGINDLEMIETAGIGVAMGNGNPVLKEKADYVTDTCLKGGIYKACKHFGLI